MGEPSDEADRPLREEQRDATEEIVEVAPGVLRFQLPVQFTGLGHVNTYVLEDERGVALVDPGLPAEQSWGALLDRLDAVGIPLTRVHSVVVTHSHPDHFGGANLLRARAEHPIEVIASRHFRTWWDPADDPDEAELDPAGAQAATERELDAELAKASPFERTTPWGGTTGGVPVEARATLAERRTEVLAWFAVPRPSLRLDDADTVQLARRPWVALHTPGHTHDHLCLLDVETGTLLSGDHVLPTITPHISGLMDGDPLARYLASLERVATLSGVENVLPAHGEPFTDLAGRVREIERHHVERLDQLRQASSALGWATVTALSRELFSSRSWGPMADSETYAHLEHLCRTGSAERRERGGESQFLVSA